MHLPLGDWQFWIVTAVVLGVVLFAVRGVVSGWKKPKRTTRVTLTIDRQKPRE